MHGFCWFSLVPYIKKFATHEYLHVLNAILATFMCILLAILLTRSLKNKKNKEVPSTKFNIINFFELISGMLLSLATEIMGEKNARKFFPVLASIFLFIFINDFMGLIPGFLPPTDNINTTFACGIFVFIYYNYAGFKEHGISYIKHYMGPMIWLAPLMFPIELISNMVRPFSLGLRLFGNITGDHLVLGIFSDLAPLIVPIPFLGLGLFVSFFQALIFVLLSMIYLTLALSHEH